MLLSDVFEQLSVGEFSQIAMGGIDSIGIDECDYPRIVPHIKLALTELYKRFPLRVEECIVQQYDQLQKYRLHSDFAQTNLESNQPIKYIMDSPHEPFVDGILRIEGVYNEGGETLFFNDSSEVWAIYTSAYDTLFTPYPMGDNVWSVKYRVDHIPIPILELDPTTTEIHIPPSLLEALLYYVASRVYSNMNTDGAMTDGNNFMQKFEMSCRKEQELNLINRNETIQTKLIDNGWV